MALRYCSAAPGRICLTFCSAAWHPKAHIRTPMPCAFNPDKANLLTLAISHISQITQGKHLPQVVKAQKFQKKRLKVEKMRGMCSCALHSESDGGRKELGLELGVILGIETSCDDTGAAVVTTGGHILGEALASQGELHAQWGGIVPTLAQEEHAKAIHTVVANALEQAGITEKDLSAVAVTIGPGLSPCLRVGVQKARAIAKKEQIPIIGVHHMEAHALVARQAEQAVTFPFLTLLISGGHNLLLLAHGVGRYTQLGSTLDDALGEAYDKTARLLGLDLSRGGGPSLEAIAREGDSQRFKFSVPMRSAKNCEFSYAGLKSSVRLAIERELPCAEKEPIGNASPEDRQTRADIAASFQRVAVQHLEDRTKRAVEWAIEMEPRVSCLVVAGGVASNTYIRSRLDEVAKEAKVQLVCPPPRLCTDNGVMVAWAGAERFKLGLWESPPSLDEPDDAWVDVRPRWPLGERLNGPSEAVKSSKKRNVFPSLTSLSSSDRS